MKKQLLKFTVPYNGTWKIIQDDAVKVNPFRVYWNNKQIERYGDLANCIHLIAQQMTGRIWHMTDERVEKLI